MWTIFPGQLLPTINHPCCLCSVKINIFPTIAAERECPLMMILIKTSFDPAHSHHHRHLPSKYCWVCVCGLCWRLQSLQQKLINVHIFSGPTQVNNNKIFYFYPFILPASCSLHKAVDVITHCVPKETFLLSTLILSC